jgi:hypothetical protein
LISGEQPVKESFVAMIETWPRGSEWRKWDLHLHAPGTKLGDDFQAGQTGWDEYCRRLHESDVQAFGITDYFSADCCFEAVKEYRQRYPKSPKPFFPNIELRTVYVVNKAQEEVHLHLIFNPFQADHERLIKSFLGALKLTKTDGAGRDIKATELSQTSDFEGATTTRDHIRDALTGTYGRDADLLDSGGVRRQAKGGGRR